MTASLREPATTRKLTRHFGAVPMAHRLLFVMMGRSVGVNLVTEAIPGRASLRGWPAARRLLEAVRGCTFDDFLFSPQRRDRESTRLNSSHVKISYAVFCLKKKKN